VHFEIIMFRPSNRRTKSEKSALARTRGLFAKKESRALMLGIEATGKTTLLYRMKLGEVVTTIPTIGFNVETISSRKGDVTVWDVGGQPAIQRLWRHYFQGTETLIYVADAASDGARFAEMKAALLNIVGEEELKDARFVIIATKQDLPNAKSVSEVVQLLDIPNILNGRPWTAVPCCAMNDNEDGWREAFEAITQTPADAAWSAASKAKPTDDEEAADERATHRVQNMLWHVLLQAHCDLEVEYSRSLHAVSFGGRAVPAEVISHIASFLPLKDLLPCGKVQRLYQRVYPQGAWVTSYTFLAACFTEAALRIGKRVVAAFQRGGGSGSFGDRGFKPETTFAALINLGLPPSLLPLGCVTAATIALALASEDSTSFLKLLRRPLDSVPLPDKCPAQFRFLAKLMGLIRTAGEALAAGEEAEDSASDAESETEDSDAAAADAGTAKLNVRLERVLDDHAAHTVAIGSEDAMLPIKAFFPPALSRSHHSMEMLAFQTIKTFAQAYAEGPAAFLNLRNVVETMVPEAEREDWGSRRGLLLGRAQTLSLTTALGPFYPTKAAKAAIASGAYRVLELEEKQDHSFSGDEVELVLDVIRGRVRSDCIAVRAEVGDSLVPLILSAVADACERKFGPSPVRFLHLTAENRRMDEIIAELMEECPGVEAARIAMEFPLFAVFAEAGVRWHLDGKHIKIQLPREARRGPKRQSMDPTAEHYVAMTAM
jgi:ADP-ribosylation factor protein 1